MRAGASRCMINGMSGWVFKRCDRMCIKGCEGGASGCVLKSVRGCVLKDMSGCERVCIERIKGCERGVRSCIEWCYGYGGCVLKDMKVCIKGYMRG